jgi:hypothetical protein
MSSDNDLLAVGLGGAAGLGLWYVLSDREAKAKAETNVDAAGATAQPTTAATACALRLDAKGLTADGVRVDVTTAVSQCKATGRADLVVASDAPSTAYADLAAAFQSAGIQVSEHRNRRNGAASADSHYTRTSHTILRDGVPIVEITRANLGHLRYALTGPEVDELIDQIVEMLEVRDAAPRRGKNELRGAKLPRYLAWCGTCYTGARLETNSRRKAEAHATSHMRLHPGHDVHVTDRREHRVEHERNARADRELAALTSLAGHVRAARSMREGSGRREAASKFARLVAKHSGAQLDDNATVDFEDNIVVSGTPGEMQKVAAWVERLARDTDRALTATVETFDDPEDPDWAVCRIRGL